MEVNIDTKAVQEAIVRAVADSTIGELIKETINKALTEKQGYNRDSILQEAAEKEINRIIGIIVREEMDKNKDKIREHILPMLTDEILNKMVSAAFEVMLGNLDS